MDLKTKISKYLTLGECVKSQSAERAGIKNIPDENQLANMKYTATHVFDKVREYVGGPLLASSFFRCPELNLLIGGASKSQHMTGEAIDIDADHYKNGTNKTIFDFIRKNLAFDQLIWEYGDENLPAWVHVSLCKDAKKNRGQILRIYNKDGRKVTVPFDLYPVK
jgi:zinc D-Ala-D-Ala carboxypeptidase